jgi:hypothetical protein
VEYGASGRCVVLLDSGRGLASNSSGVSICIFFYRCIENDPFQTGKHSLLTQEAFKIMPWVSSFETLSLLPVLVILLLVHFVSVRNYMGAQGIQPTLLCTLWSRVPSVVPMGPSPGRAGATVRFPVFGCRDSQPGLFSKAVLVLFVCAHLRSHLSCFTNREKFLFT